MCPIPEHAIIRIGVYVWTVKQFQRRLCDKSENMYTLVIGEVLTETISHTEENIHRERLVRESLGEKER